MFQSLGVRNERWRGRLNNIALAYGLVVFLGFIAVPVAVQVSLHSDHPALPVKTVLDQVEKASQARNPDLPVPVMINYDAAPAKSAQN